LPGIDDLEAPSDAIIDAVERAPGRRLSASDAAALAGIDLVRARNEMMAMASLAQGDLDVTNDGNIIYSFNSDFRGILQRRSPVLRLRRFWQQTLYPPLLFAVKSSFALFLFSSLAIIAATVIVATNSGSGSGSDSSSNRNSKKRDDGRSETNRSRALGGFSFSGPSPWDLLVYPPRRNSGTSSYLDSQSKSQAWDILMKKYSQDQGLDYTITGIESFFSFVFGDDDPNDGFSQAQLVVAAEKIRKNGGIVIAEDLAPYLSPPARSSQVDDGLIVNESWTLPAVISLGGEPMVDENGNIFYAFPELASSAFAEKKEKDSNALPVQLYEQRSRLSRATNAMKFVAGLLGLGNLLGIRYLRIILSDTAFLRSAPLWSNVLMRLYPGLAVYAAVYALTPLLRWAILYRKNSDIALRNKNRASWTLPSPLVDSKRADVLETARKRGLIEKLKQLGSPGNLFYSTRSKQE